MHALVEYGERTEGCEDENGHLDTPCLPVCPSLCPSVCPPPPPPPPPTPPPPPPPPTPHPPEFLPQIVIFTSHWSFNLFCIIFHEIRVYSLPINLANIL